MPLHLLGKKSWNVYNQDNIERVKRDEAAEKAKEEAEEQRMQELDAERRMQALRGEEPIPLPVDDKLSDNGRERQPNAHRRERKERRRAGEDHTDFEMRVARQQISGSNSERQVVLRKPTDAPLVDHAGHIDLFPQAQPKRAVVKNAEAEKEAARKKKENEDQYIMKFSNAAGFRQGLESPWYSKAGNSKEAAEDEMPSKDVWGNEDPRRKERDASRIVSNDPLAAMRQGAAQVRQVEKERKRWREEKGMELQKLEAEERRKRHKGRHAEESSKDLDNFMLDEKGDRRDRETERKRRRHHEASQSRRQRAHHRGDHRKHRLPSHD